MELQSLFLITIILDLLSGAEYVASIENLYTMLLFLVISNFLNAVSCQCLLFVSSLGETFTYSMWFIQIYSEDLSFFFNRVFLL